MKKIRVLLIVGLILSMVLIGCAKHDDNKSNAGNTDNTNTEAGDNTDNNKESKEPENNKLLEKFINGEVSALANDGIEGLTKDKAYTINEMAEAFASSEGEYYMPGILDKIQYGAIDAGGDGEAELALKFVYTNEDKNDFAEIMAVVKNFNGTLRVILRTDSYYRGYSDILINGIVISGGSNSAFEHVTEYRYIDAAGNVNFIMSVDTALGLRACIIPAGYLPEVIDSTEFPTVPELCTEEDEENAYSLEMIKTAEYDWENYDAMEYYEFSKKHMYFIFADSKDEFKEADPEYAEYYKNKQVNVVAPDKAGTFLESVFAQYGFDNTDTDYPVVEWKDIDAKEE